MANHQATHAEIVPVLFENESNVVYAPLSPVEGHWFGVVNLDHGASAYQTAVHGNGAPVQSPDGRGMQTPSVNVLDAWRCYIWTFINGTWRITGGHMPDITSEVWGFSDPGQANPLPIVGATRVPLTYDTTLLPAPYYFEAVGDGTIRCLKRFVGLLNLVGYFDILMTGNNQYGSANLLINVLAGSALIRQGFGVFSSASSPRSGSQQQSNAMPCIAIVEPAAVLELNCTDDPLQSATTWVYDQTHIDFQAV